MKISGCVITKNEEANIARCINNLKSVTDEIIVVDTGSVDQTIQIAKELGAFVYEDNWEQDFSKARNAALEHASGDWIIFLDADEYFNEESLLRIRQIIEEADTNQNIEGILCNLENIDTESGGRFIDSLIVMRIFRNRKEFRFMNKIHEQIGCNGRTLKHVNYVDRIRIIHTGYSKALQYEKAKRNLKFLLDDTENKTAVYHLAVTYFILHDFENAYKYADMALSERAINEVDHLAYKMHFYKIFISLMESDRDKTEFLIREANRRFGNHPEIAKLEGTYYLKEKRYTNAYEKYLHALNCQIKYGAVLGQNSFNATIHEVYFSIGYLLDLMNREGEAFDYYTKAIQASRYQKEIFKSLFALCRTLPENETIAFLNGLYDIGSEKDLRFMVGQVAGCGLSKIVLYYAEKWNKRFGHEDDVLIYAFLELGDYQSALEIAMVYLQKDKAAFSPVVAAIMILNGKFPKASAIRENIEEDYYDLVESYWNRKQYSGSKEAFLSVLTILIKYADGNLTGCFIETGDNLELTQGIAEVYLRDRQHESAIPYYRLLAESESNEAGKAEAAFQTGYCFYKLRQYEESIDWFESAIQSGYTENDLMEFIRWIAEQTQDDGVKSKAKVLKGMA